MKTRIVIVAVLAAFCIVALSTMSKDAGASVQVTDYRAGTAAFTAGTAGININFSSPLPSTKYSLVVQPTNTAGYSPTSVCTYFNPLHKRVDGFEVQHKRCDNGVPVKLDDNVSLDWIVVMHN